MKNILKLCFIASLFFLGSQSIYASGMFGWETTVKAFNHNISPFPWIQHHNPIPLTNVEHHVHGASLIACENQRQDLVNTLVAYGHDNISDNPCMYSLMVMGIDDFTDLVNMEPRWPWPECIICPILDKLSIIKLYPDYVTEVNSLMKEYQIYAYNRALADLQFKVDLEGFQEKMMKIEMLQKMADSKLK